MSNCRANRGRGRGLAGATIKRPYVQRMALLRSFPQFGSAVEARAAGTFCEFHLNDSRSSWRVPPSPSLRSVSSHQGPSSLVPSPISQLPLVHPAAEASRAAGRGAEGGGGHVAGCRYTRFMRVSVRRGGRHNTVSLRVATPPPSIGIPLSVSSRGGGGVAARFKDSRDSR